MDFKSVAAILMLSLVLVAGCAQQQKAPQQQEKETAGQAMPEKAVETITIGFIAPLTGDAAEIGQGARDAVQLAAEEVSLSWKGKGKELKVIYEDGKCSPEPAANAANKLVNVDRAPVIIGGTCSSETLAAAPVAEGKTIVLSFCSSSPKVTNAGDYVFRDYPSDSFAGIVAAEYVYNKLGEKKVAIANCLSDWCIGLADAFKAKFKELGGEIVAQEGFEQTSTDIKSQLTKIKDSKAKAVYMPSYTNATVVGLQQAKELGLEAKFVGGDAWDDPTIPKQAGSSAEGIVFLVPKTPKNAEFEKKMAGKFKREKISVCAAQAYDAVKIVAGIMERVGPDAGKIKDELYKVKDYKGVSGSISFDENGDLVGAEYTFKTVKNGEIIELEGQ